MDAWKLHQAVINSWLIHFTVYFYDTDQKWTLFFSKYKMMILSPWIWNSGSVFGSENKDFIELCNLMTAASQDEA